METWAALADRQLGVIARRQLLRFGVDADRVRNEFAARRWTERTSRVLTTFTGEPTWRQRVWIAALHAGGSALVGGLSALEWHGLSNWHRDDITVLVDDQLSFDPVPGISFFRTRRPLQHFAQPSAGLPLCRVAPAVLLFAGYERSARTAQGAVAAAVQQRLVPPEELLAELALMKPLRRSRLLRATISDIAGGADSVAEIDLGRLCLRAGLPAPRRQVRRRDANRRLRFTDCEWSLPDGRVLILEIDGAFHMDVTQWEKDLARQRRLSSRGGVMIRCTARELRDQPDRIVRDLIAHGLGA